MSNYVAITDKPGANPERDRWIGREQAASTAWGGDSELEKSQPFNQKIDELQTVLLGNPRTRELV